MKQLQDTTAVRTGVRLPPDLLRWLREQAHERNESLNAAVVRTLNTGRKIEQPH